jgi:dihydroneopterin aldolase
MRIWQIKLENVKFFSFHGLFPEERILGNEFTLSVSVDRISNESISKNLEQSIDYGVLYSICSEVMRKPVDLLETICEEIVEKIQLICPDYQLIEISVTKENPPLGQISGHSIVKLSVSKD